MTDALWTPTAEQIAAANLTRLIADVGSQHTSVTDYPSLYRWSIQKPELFWAKVWEFCGVVHSQAAERVLDDPRMMPGAKWFPGARLNFAENLLRFGDEQPALVCWNENGRQRSLSYAELFQQVQTFASALRQCGVETGDRVVGFMPNTAETVIAMLAATSIGAIWSSTSPDFGLQGVMDRFGQIKPKVLITADAYQYGGKIFDSLARVADVVNQIPTIESVVVVPYINSRPDVSGIRSASMWNEFIKPIGDARLTFEQLPFDHPLYILYSSGTTGVPKCIVHGAGGTLLQHLKELVLHCDLKRDDRVFYFTTCGWMMWNWLVSSLAVGATVVLYDGSPFYPDAKTLWDLAEQEKLTVFGTSAKYISALEKAGVQPIASHDLSELDSILSTGSPLAAESFDFVYDQVKPDVRLSSISGGTDIVACFALGNPIAPVYRGQLQALGLGMKVKVYDDAGEPVNNEKGELVCEAPFPSMPVHFWNDPAGAKYRTAYFEHFPGVWRHGDFAELTEQGGMIIHGRSDAVLNPGGVRIGTAEIYREVEQIDEVLESIVVGQQWQADTRVILFVKLRDNVTLDNTLVETIKQQIRSNTTPRHVPARVIQVADIPRTISGKIVELAVRDVIHGRPVKNKDALANPDALSLFRDLPELQSR